MAEPDYYALIGVGKESTLHEIRAKFRAKVLAEHPDKGGDPQKFNLLNKAYNVLTDVEKRRRYDATGRTEISAEEEFARSFAGGVHAGRPRDADSHAVVNMQDRLSTGKSSAHEEGFAEWMRSRDQSEMCMTDKDFMKNALFNAAELATNINHQGQVHHVLGSPKTDAYGQALGGAVQVQAKPRPVKKAIDHDEVLVRMLAVPVDDSMVYAELNKSGVCLGMTGIGRIEQVGSRVDASALRQEDPVLVLPKPTKFSAQRPIGTARTLLICNEEDLLRIPPEIMEELTPEQICLAPTIVCAYTLLEVYGARLKPGDSVLLNAAHLSACGSSILQLCKLLKLKPICLLPLPGAPKNSVKGEYGSKKAWQDVDNRAVAPPTVRSQYDNISQWLLTMGAEEVFPDSVALLQWRDRNQRMLPKLALDGIATRESTEQLIHCLQPGDKDAQVVVYGHGVAQPIEIAPSLLAAWGGSLIGFNIGRWVHSLSANAKKMMAVMENITKLVRANKFTLDTVLFKVGEDSIADSFSRAADATDSSQVVLIFPTLQEELGNTGDVASTAQARPKAAAPQVAAQKEYVEDERERLKREWLDLLFTKDSVAAQSPEGPLPITQEGGNTRNPSSLIVWLGDNAQAESQHLRGLYDTSSAAVISLSWADHVAGEGLLEFNLDSAQVVDGTWYLRERSSFENEDLDMLHDVELLGRCMMETIQPKLSQFGLDWAHVVFVGFGKGAGVMAWASLARIIPQQISGMILFSPIVPFPQFLAEKVVAVQRPSTSSKMFNIWGARNRSTPGAYRTMLAQALRKAPDVKCTPDTLPQGEHCFDQSSSAILTSLLPLCLAR